MSAPQLESSRGCAVTSAWHGLRSAPSPCTSSTTTSCSRTRAPRPPITRQRARPARPARRRRRSSTRGSAQASRAVIALLAGVFGVHRGHRGRSLHASGRAFGGRLHRAALASLRARADRSWRRDVVAIAPPRRPALVALRSAGPARLGAAVVAYVVVVPLAISYVVTHASRATVPAADLGAPYEKVAFTTDDGLRLRGLVHPFAERRGGDLVPGAGELAETGEAARTTRLRRAALRPPRRGGERRRPQPLRVGG